MWSIKPKTNPSWNLINIIYLAYFYCCADSKIINCESKILGWSPGSTKLDILHNFNTMGLPTSGHWILDQFISDVILKIKGYTIFVLKTTCRFCKLCFPLHLLYVLNILIKISLTLFLLLISFISYVHNSHFNVLWDFLCFTKKPILT